MAITTDHTLTHLRKVGTGKGPAVQTVRAQVCKTDYPLFMRSVMESQPNLTLIEGQVMRVLEQEGRVAGAVVILAGSNEGFTVECRAVVVTSGTFLNGLCHEGKTQTVAARHGDEAVIDLATSLKSFGLDLRRFKTGTTPRIRLSSVDLTKTEVLPSELDAGPLSFLHDHPFPKHGLLPTWQTHTNQTTHQVLRDNLLESALFGGHIEGVGPRYCPSIEDKVVRFAAKEAHPVFLEQEEWDSESIYVQGFSSSMPAEIQLAALKTISGLENVDMMRPGYAVEYDAVDPLQLTPTLMTKPLKGLFMAGQINGTSGYEEAAGQGIVAGINAALYAQDREPFLIGRDDAFIGVMIDDLVTKGVDDPYRMLTARAEHRLLLRHDNADRRLTPMAIDLGLASDERIRRLELKREAIERGRAKLEETTITNAQDADLGARGMSMISGRTSLFDILRRPGTDLDAVEELGVALGLLAKGELPQKSEDVGEPLCAARAQIEIEAMYDGYLKRQIYEVAQAKKLESFRIPEDFDYLSLGALSFESKEKLSRIRPMTVGQASRVPGVRPTDIALLIGFLRAWTK